MQHSKKLNRHVTAMLNRDVTNTLVYVSDHSVNSQESHSNFFVIAKNKSNFCLREHVQLHLRLLKTVLTAKNRFFQFSNYSDNKPA